MNVKDEIIKAVQERKTAIAWHLSEAIIVYIPDHAEAIAIRKQSENDETASAILQEAAVEAGIPVLEVQGHSGIAATDPHWDGSETLFCDRCSIVHDSDEVVAENLLKRARRN